MRGRLSGAVALLVLVHPVGPGVGDRGPEIEAVRQRHRREVVAARKAAVGIGAASGIDEVTGAAARIDRRRTNAHVVQIALEGCRRAVVHQHHALDRAARRDAADIDRDRVPLVRIQRPTLALRARRGTDPVLVDRASRGQPAAVVEDQIHRDVIGRIAQVVAVCVGEDPVREPRIGLDRQRGGEQVHLLPAARVAVVVQRMQTGEPDAGLAVRAAALVGPPATSTVKDDAAGMSSGAGSPGSNERCQTVSGVEALASSGSTATSHSTQPGIRRTGDRFDEDIPVMTNSRRGRGGSGFQPDNAPRGRPGTDSKNTVIPGFVSI